MPDGTLARSYGKVFDEVAAEYDRHRPTYPPELVDHACELAGIGPGDLVLEIGCGTGQLTRELLARGLRVTAVEPGGRLVALARENLRGAGDVRFVNARLEDALLPRARFCAAFSASAIHWIDPDVGWRRVAEALAPGGTLALIQCFGLKERRTDPDVLALMGAIEMIAPEIAAEWPRCRSLEGTLAGVRERRGNVSAVWAWLGSYKLAREHAAALFEDAQIAALPALVEHTAEELGALLATMSFWARISPAQRDALREELLALQQRLGRPIRSGTVTCAVTARRVTARGASAGSR
jgi:SAM-dependent methyltransferase